MPCAEDCCADWLTESADWLVATATAFTTACVSDAGADWDTADATTPEAREAEEGEDCWTAPITALATEEAWSGAAAVAAAATVAAASAVSWGAACGFD